MLISKICAYFLKHCLRKIKKCLFLGFVLIIQLRSYFVLEIALAGVSKQPYVRGRHVARQLVLEIP